ncbi:MAG: hypothetical protein SOZ58_11060 [Prevotella sp.]|nr:hypothetical protein [Prevotella sp.]
MKKYVLMSLVASFILVSCQESMEDKCAREVSEFTRKKCPSRIDDNIIIDSMTFDRERHVIGYWYTATGLADNPKVFAKTDMKKTLINQVHNSTSLKSYRDAGYSFRYVYRSASKKDILFDTTVK